MTLVWSVSGTQVPTGFECSQMSTGATAVSLVVSELSDLSLSMTYGPATPNSDGVCKVTATGLEPGVNYYYGWTHNGTLQSYRGRCRTARTSGSFRFLASGCLESNSNDPITAAMATTGADFHAMLGDLDYLDNDGSDSTALALRKSTWTGDLTRSNMAALLAAMPLVYCMSDHDSGPNSSYKDSPGHLVSYPTHRAWFPSHPLPDTAGKGLWRTFVHGRVRFIMTDTRAYRNFRDDTDNASKTMMGAEQKAWFKAQIAAATEPLIVWLEENPWGGTALAGQDTWRGYTTERQELADFIVAAGKASRLYMIASDMHALAYVAKGSANNPYGGWPIAQCGPLEKSRSSTNTAAPYDIGPFPGTANVVAHQYGLFDVADNGATITVTFTGKDITATNVIAPQTETYTATAPATPIAQGRAGVHATRADVVAEGTARLALKAQVDALPTTGGGTVGSGTFVANDGTPSSGAGTFALNDGTP